MPPPAAGKTDAEMNPPQQSHPPTTKGSALPDIVLTSQQTQPNVRIAPNSPRKEDQRKLEKTRNEGRIASSVQSMFPLPSQAPPEHSDVSSSSPATARQGGIRWGPLPKVSTQCTEQN